MTALHDPPIIRPSRRAVLAAPAGFAAPIVASTVDDEAITICRAWLANKAEMMRLFGRWGEIEDHLVRVHGWSLSDNALKSPPQAAPLRAISARLDQLSAERELLARKLPLLKATTREGVMLKFEVVQAELFVADFPIIHGLLGTAVRDLAAIW